jgi:peptidoglycan/LPS O-acetylase OafA/YrhL
MPFGDLHHMRFLGPLWSLAIEEQFYLFWPVCVWRVSTKALMMICGLGMLGSLLLRLCLIFHPTAALSYVVYVNTLTRLDGLLAGAFCAIVVRNPTLSLRMRKSIPAVAVAVVSGMALLVLTGHQAWNDPDVLIYAHLLFAIGFGYLVLSAYFLDRSGTLFDKAFRSRGLGAFGKYSSRIYARRILPPSMVGPLVRKRSCEETLLLSQSFGWLSQFSWLF